MPEDVDPADIFALLDDNCARAILKATNQQPMTAPQLVDTCDASRATVYRRIDELIECGLLTESLDVDRDGNHRGKFTATLNRLSIELTDDEFTLSIDADPADRLTRFWDQL